MEGQSKGEEGGREEGTLRAYFEKGKGGSSKTDDGEEHDDQGGSVQHTNGLGRCKLSHTFLEVES